MSSIAARFERHQVPLYLIAIAVGGVVGALGSDVAATLEHAITPTLAALLFVTFLQVPAASLLDAARSGRFIAAVLIVNFVAVPVVVAVLAGLVPPDSALRVGVVLVLLCPCIDYVIVFSGLAGADSRRLLAATPLLLLVQILLLPLYSVMYLGTDFARIIDAGPFVTAFTTLIALPLTLAWATQWWASRRRAGELFAARTTTLMVPLMMAVLALVVGSQLPLITDDWRSILAAVPVFVAFLVIMPIIGTATARALRLDVGAQRAVAFSGATRNSLVVLPMALALPVGYELVAAVVVTQTLVEVIGMVVYVRAVPRLITDADVARRSRN